MKIFNWFSQRKANEAEKPSATSSPTPTIDDISLIWLRISVEERAALFILLGSDGTVKRLGTGTVENSENDFYIGKTAEPLFQKLHSQIDPGWLPQMGSIYSMPKQKGMACELIVGFVLQDGRGSSLKFKYGSESQGPPDDIVQFVIKAAKLTDPWYERFRDARK
jgi:hypothetical protein